jgi:RNA polymerase sigma-70 factor (ECF subfamily)
VTQEHDRELFNDIPTPVVQAKSVDKPTGSGTDHAGRISQLATLWSVVCRAHGRSEEERIAARHQLLERYRGAVYRYAWSALRDHDAAEEVVQEFALQMLRGGFHRADPSFGRFRDYLKTTLWRLVARYQQRQRNQALPLPDDFPDPGEKPSALDLEAPEFTGCWRAELLARAWEALSRVQEQTGRPYYTILRRRIEQPDVRSRQLAEQLSPEFGRPLTAVGLRQLLHRARECFADLLLSEVAQTLHNPTREQLAQELIELGLLEYCRPALERYGGER